MESTRIRAHDCQNPATWRRKAGTLSLHPVQCCCCPAANACCPSHALKSGTCMIHHPRPRPPPLFVSHIFQTPAAPSLSFFLMEVYLEGTLHTSPQPHPTLRTRPTRDVTSLCHTYSAVVACMGGGGGSCRRKGELLAHSLSLRKRSSCSFES